jgi:membrane protein
VGVVSPFYGEETARGELEAQLGLIVGESSASNVAGLLENAELPGSGNIAAMLIGIGVLLFGATGAFAQLQYSLNKAWSVEADPKQNTISIFIRKRLLSFGLVIALGALLIASLMATTAVQLFGAAFADWMASTWADRSLGLANFVLSFLLIALLFAVMYKYMPDVVVAWRDVWVGALVTSLLFAVGKYLIGLYLSNSRLNTFYGAAGSFAIILVWIYFSSMIVLLGAEFVQIWARWRGAEILPSHRAIRVIERKEKLEE